MSSESGNRSAVSFFLAFFLSAFGYEFIFFVMTLHIFDLNRSALQTGVFAALTFLPRLLSPVCGAVADRVGRGRVLAAAAAAAALLLVALACAKRLYAVYAIWFLLSVAFTFIVNVRSSVMAEIVPKDKYRAGNSVMLILSSASRLLAPLAGGMLSQSAGFDRMLYVAGAVYLAISVVCCFICIPTRAGDPAESFRYREIFEGFRYLLAERRLKYLASLGFLWRLFLGLQTSLFVVYVKSCLSGSDTQYSLFTILLGIGSILGSVIGARFAGRMKGSRIVTLGLAAHFASFAALGLIHDFTAACAAAFIGFAAFYFTVVGMHSERDRVTPSSVRGRVYGCVTGTLTVPAVLSMLAGGYLADVFKADVILLAAGCLAIVSLAAVTFAFGVLPPRPSENREIAIDKD